MHPLEQTGSVREDTSAVPNTRRLTVHGKLERGRRGKIVDDTNNGELRLRSGEEAGLRKERGSGRY